MPHSPDKFLRHPTRLSRKATLGRVFNVTRETWSLADDPQSVPPQAELMVSGHTASEAADLAREMAEAYDRHGFHKASSSWWGADQTHFHRFVVHAGHRGGREALIVGSTLLGLAAIWLARGKRRRSGKAGPGDAA